MAPQTNETKRTARGRDIGLIVAGGAESGYRDHWQALRHTARSMRIQKLRRSL